MCFWLRKCKDCAWYDSANKICCMWNNQNIEINSYCPDWTSKKKEGELYKTIKNQMDVNDRCNEYGNLNKKI